MFQDGGTSTRSGSFLSHVFLIVCCLFVGVFDFICAICLACSTFNNKVESPLKLDVLSCSSGIFYFLFLHSLFFAHSL